MERKKKDNNNVLDMGKGKKVKNITVTCVVDM